MEPYKMNDRIKFLVNNRNVPFLKGDEGVVVAVRALTSLVSIKGKILMVPNSVMVKHSRGIETSDTENRRKEI